MTDIKRDTMNMADQILQLVTERRNVTFVELSRCIPGFKGHKSLFVTDGEHFSNIVFWTRLSDEAAAALCELTNAGKIHKVKTDIGTY